MLTNNKIKIINSLKEKKFRSIHKQFVIEGNKIVGEVIQSHPNLIRHLICLSDWIDNFPENYIKNIPDISVVTEKEIRKISLFTTGSKAIAVLDIPEHQEMHISADELYLILDNIQDPGNLGTIIRTADWFGIKNIICSPDTADCYNPKVLQSTMGSILRVNILYTGLSDFLKKYSVETKIKIYGTFIDGEPVYSANLTKGGFIIMGNESKGIHNDYIPYINKRITIPSFKNKDETVDSLNVATATAIICSEFRRRYI